jgi:hypothetical protein
MKVWKEPVKGHPGKWDIRWREGGRQRYKRFYDDAEANAFRDAKEAEIRASCAISPEDSEGYTLEESGIDYWNLRAWSFKGGPGYPGGDGEILKSWTEPRLCGDCIRKKQVWDKKQCDMANKNFKPAESQRNLDARHQAALDFLDEIFADGKPHHERAVKQLARERGIIKSDAPTSLRFKAALKERGIQRVFLSDKRWWLSPTPDDRREKAIEWLEKLLRPAPLPSQIVHQMALNAGVTDAFLEQAKVALEITITDPFHPPRYWCLPGQTAPTQMNGTQAKLSDRQRDILQVLFRNKAFDISHRMTTKDIVDDVEGEGRGFAASFARPIADLKNRGLIHTKEGKGGGSWLTELGQSIFSE